MKLAEFEVWEVRDVGSEWGPFSLADRTYLDRVELYFTEPLPGVIYRDDPTNSA